MGRNEESGILFRGGGWLFNEGNNLRRGKLVTLGKTVTCVEEKNWVLQFQAYTHRKGLS